MEEGGEFNHGFTYSGHPVSCAVAVANIQLMQKESIVKRVHDTIGPYLQRRWAELADHPLVGETRWASDWSPRWKSSKDKADQPAFRRPRQMRG